MTADSPALWYSTHSEQVSALLEVLDSRQATEHTLQTSTLGHHPSHLIHLLLILLFIYRKTQTFTTLAIVLHSEVRFFPSYSKFFFCLIIVFWVKEDQNMAHLWSVLVC